MRVKFLILIALTLGLAGCVFEQNRKIERLMEKSVLEFHQSINDERYQDIYERSSGKLKAQLSEEKFVAQLEQIHNSFSPLPNKAHVFVPDELRDGIKRTFVAKREVFTTFQIIGNETEVTTERFEWSVKGDNAELVSYKTDAICKKPCGLGIKK